MVAYRCSRIDKAMAERSTIAVGSPADADDGHTIDPTKNVLDLVRAESKYQDAMREALEKRVLSDSVWLKELVHQSAISESRRIDQLAQTRQEFQNTIRDMLAESVRSTSTLVSTQLVQIQATFDSRVSKLEAAAFTQAGKSSVTDPQITDAIARLGLALASSKTATDETMQRMATTIASIGASGTRQESQRMGQGQVIAWIIGAAMFVGSIATPLIAFLALTP